MTTLAPAATRGGPRILTNLRWDLRALRIWTLASSLILYLGFSGGGYALSTYGHVGIVVWWAVIVACAWALLPAGALSRLALAGLVVFGAFTLWTALGISWSISSGRSFPDLALVTGYFGILVLGVTIHRDRLTAIRRTVPAVATSLAILAAFSLATRLWPDFIPSAVHIDQAGGRLAWPLDYWNALAAMTAMALPLLLAIATTDRRAWAQALAAATIPVVALCGALTQSRGGVLEAAAAVAVWLALSTSRLAKSLTVTICGLASAAVIAVAFGDRAIRNAQTGALQHHQAIQLVAVLLVACAAVAVAQLVVGRYGRRVRFPQGLAPTPTASAMLWAAVVILGVAIAIAAGVPHHLTHAWNDFKHPVNSGGGATHLSANSGEGRYQYWVAAVQSAAAHPLTGSGPGTFQLDWLPRAHITSYVINAHNLYVETYAELGVPGLGLLVVFILISLAATLRSVIGSRGPRRARAAAITAALVGFYLGAAVDWLWQMPVLVAALLLLTGAALAPTDRAAATTPAAKGRSLLSARGILALASVVVGLLACAVIAYPLLVNNAISTSQAAINAGDLTQALRNARHAVSLEPGSGAAHLQLALVQERRGDFPAALGAARAAVRREPDNWVDWLTLSRIDVETGQPRAAVADYEKARSLNPMSGLFASST